MAHIIDPETEQPLYRVCLGPTQLPAAALAAAQANQIKKFHDRNRKLVSRNTKALFKRILNRSTRKVLTASQIRGDGVNAYFTQQAGVFEDLNFDLFANLVRESFPVDDDLTRTLILQSLGNILAMNQRFTAL